MKIFRFVLATLVLAVSISFAYCQDPAKQNFKGIGITYKSDSAQKSLIISKVLSGNAGAEAGLREGDFMLAIDGKNLWDLSADQRASALRGGKNGEPYVMQIQRTIITSLGEKQQIKDVKLTPRLIAAETCLSGDCENSIGKKLNNSSGESMEGRFVNGSLVEGKVYFKSGRVKTSGTFLNGLLHGPNCTTYHDKINESGYEAIHRTGYFEKGLLKKGNMYSFDTKSQWSGSFDETGKEHGKDFNFRGNGQFYEGDMEHGEKTGYAKSMSYNGGNYEGPVVKGKPEGSGTWYFSGREYKGKFINGLMEGQFKVVEKTNSGRYRHVYNYRNGVQL